jgi:putative transcriptional regulator
VGNKVRELRKQLDPPVTIEEAAKVVGVTRQTFGDVERGKWEPRLKTALKIARLLGRPVEEVFTLDEDAEA